MPVFEVKLNGVDAPDWLEKLLSKSRIYDGHKFSKYLMGASVIFPKCVATLPYWASNPLFEELYRGLLDENQHIVVGHNAMVVETTDLLESKTSKSSKGTTDDELASDNIDDLPERRYCKWFMFPRKDERKALLPTAVPNKQKNQIEVSSK